MDNDDDDVRILELYQKFSSEIYQLEKIQQIVASISLLFSFSVVFILLIRYKILVKDKPFSFIILIIAVSDSFASLAFSFGYPKGQLCIAQPAILFFFERLSWIYTTILVFQLHNLIIYKKLLRSLWLDVSVLFINVLLAVLPLTTNTQYGTLAIEDGYKLQGYFVCTMHNGESNSMTAEGQSYADVWLRWTTINPYFVCLFLILIFYVRICLHDLFPEGICSFLCKGRVEPLLRSVNSSTSMIEAKITITLYVFAIIISWTPNTTYGAYSLHILNNQPIQDYNTIQDHLNAIKINDKLDILCPMYGLLLSIIFYVRTIQARKEWIFIFLNIYQFFADSRDVTESVVSNESHWVEAERISESELTTQKKVMQNNTDSMLVGIL